MMAAEGESRNAEEPFDAEATDSSNRGDLSGTLVMLGLLFLLKGKLP